MTKNVSNVLGDLKPPAIHMHLGGQILKFDETEIKLSLEYQAKPEFANPMGHLQGGMLCSMLDDAMGLFALLAYEGKPSATVSLNIAFLRPCALEKVNVEVYFVRQGKKISNIESIAYQKGKAVGKATAVFTLI